MQYLLPLSLCLFQGHFPVRVPACLLPPPFWSWCAAAPAEGAGGHNEGTRFPGEGITKHCLSRAGRKCPFLAWLYFFCLRQV